MQTHCSVVLFNHADETPRKLHSPGTKYADCFCFYIQTVLFYHVVSAMRKNLQTSHHVETWNHVPLSGMNPVRSPWTSDCDGKSCELTFRCFLESSEPSVYIFCPTCFHFHSDLNTGRWCTSLYMGNRALACLVFYLKSVERTCGCWERTKSPELLSFK